MDCVSINIRRSGKCNISSFCRRKDVCFLVWCVLACQRIVGFEIMRRLCADENIFIWIEFV